MTSSFLRIGAALYAAFFIFPMWINITALVCAVIVGLINEERHKNDH